MSNEPSNDSSKQNINLNLTFELRRLKIESMHTLQHTNEQSQKCLNILHIKQRKEQQQKILLQNWS